MAVNLALQTIIKEQTKPEKVQSRICHAATYKPLEKRKEKRKITQEIIQDATSLRAERFPDNLSH